MTAQDSQNGFLLSALHEASARENPLSRETLGVIAERFKMSLAELTGFIRFFHFFECAGATPQVHGSCRGPSCSLNGQFEAGASDAEGIACSGLCDHPVPRFDGVNFASHGDELAAYAPAGITRFEDVLLKYGRPPHSQRIETYRSLGGYEQYLRLLSSGKVEETLSQIEASGLRGRGGAAFPVGAKLRIVHSQEDPLKYMVCNADEGEPATFKDRVLLHLEPHLVLEGMMICAYLTGASEGLIYLRYEYPHALKELENAIQEARAAGLLGKRSANGGYHFDIQVVRGAGSYVCGEEGALLNSLEGRMPWPRERPPFPTEKGLFDKPTLVNNVETFCCIPPLLAGGATWFQNLGRGANSGTKIYSVSGKVQRPGNYELPLGIAARELIVEIAGGTPSGEQPKAFTLGGISGGLLGSKHLDLPLDFQSPAQEGCSLGSGGIVVLDETCCIVDFVRSCLLFYESESCGRCFPCRIGTIRLREFLDGMTGRTDRPKDALRQAEEIREAMAVTSACGLGRSVPLIIDGMLRHFADEFDEHLKKRTCRTGVCPL